MCSFEKYFQAKVLPASRVVEQVIYVQYKPIASVGNACNQNQCNSKLRRHSSENNLTAVTSDASSCQRLVRSDKHWWFSGRILACHAGGPGSIPGQCKCGSSARLCFILNFPLTANLLWYFHLVVKEALPSPDKSYFL